LTASGMKRTSSGLFDFLPTGSKWEEGRRGTASGLFDFLPTGSKWEEGGRGRASGLLDFLPPGSKFDEEEQPQSNLISFLLTTSGRKRNSLRTVGFPSS
jgi:hypothetical protein